MTRSVNIMILKANHVTLNVKTFLEVQVDVQNKCLQYISYFTELALMSPFHTLGGLESLK